MTVTVLCVGVTVVNVCSIRLLRRHRVWLQAQKEAWDRAAAATGGDDWASTTP